MYPTHEAVGVADGSSGGVGGAGVAVVTKDPSSFGGGGGGGGEENSTSTLQTMEEAQCTWFTLIIYVVIFGPLCVLGLIGNSLSFVVLHWERHSHVATFLLQVMACADNLFLLTTGFSQIFTAITIFINDNSNPLSAYITVCVWPLVHVTQMWTVWITVLIAVNRYVAICRPFQAPLWCTMTQARRQVVVLAAIIIFYNLPRFFENRIEHTKGYPEAALTDIKQSPLYNILYENVLYCLFVFLGPLVILVVLNACLIRELIMSRQRLRALQLPGQQGAGGDDQEQNLTLVMIVIILVFVVCQTPAFLNQLLYYALQEEGYVCGMVYFYYFHISNIVISANSSVNFIIYCVFRRQFRQRLVAFCRRSRRPTDKHPDTILLNTIRFNRASSPPPPYPPPLPPPVQELSPPVISVQQSVTPPI